MRSEMKLVKPAQTKNLVLCPRILKRKKRAGGFFIRARVFHLDPADIHNDPQSFTMKYNSSTILYHDPADLGDMTYVRNDPL